MEDRDVEIRRHSEFRICQNVANDRVRQCGEEQQADSAFNQQFRNGDSPREQQEQDDQSQRKRVPNGKEGVDEEDRSIEEEGDRHSAANGEIESEESQSISEFGMRKIVDEETASAGIGNATQQNGQA
ncbi:MAG: hypothetical protein ACLQFI_01565 [Methylocella sp.]